MKHKNLTKTWSFLLLILAIILTVVPFLWIVATSFKDFISIMSSKSFFSPTLKNYTNLFAGRDSEYPRFLLNSVIVSLSTTFISLVIGSMGSYSLARLPIPFKLDKILLGWLLVVRIIHPMAFALPFFMIIYRAGLYNTLYALIFVYTAINMPFTIWMMKGFFEEVSEEIEESAMIDGCSRFKVFSRIALPLVAPGLAATAIFCFILAWNEFLLALILTSSPQSMTLPVGIARLNQQYFVKWGEMSAAATVFTVPIFVFASLVQRHLIRGMTFGAIKG